MKKYLTRVAKVAFVLSTSYFVLSWSAHAAEVACTNHWESAYSCDQCFQFFLTEADVAFSTSDIFYPRANLESDEKEILWIQDSEIRSFAMNSADIGPIGNVKNFFDFPHEVSNHASNGEDYTSFRAGESKTWARMKNGSAFGVQRIPRDADIDEPIFRIEYTTVSEVEDTSGDIVSGSRRQHKECAMYFPLDLNAGGNPSIEITKDDDDNHDDYQRINESTGRTISGEARFSGRAHFWIEVRNTGDVTLEDVYVTDDHVRECNRAIGRLEPGEVYDYTCVDEYVSESYTNRARVSAHPIGTHGADSIISDEDDTLVEVGDRDRDCRIEVDPSSGNAPLNVDIRCHCETNDVQIDIVQ